MGFSAIKKYPNGKALEVASDTCFPKPDLVNFHAHH
jgi:hypothetical protein